MSRRGPFPRGADLVVFTTKTAVGVGAAIMAETSACGAEGVSVGELGGARTGQGSARH